MPIAFEECEPPAGEADLDAAEAEIGFPLHPDHRAHLLRFNGGAPVPCDFDYDDPGRGPNASGVAWFLAAYPGPHENLVKYIRMFADRVPSGCYPIARDPGGNPILIGMANAGALAGKIYFWKRESERDDGPAPPDTLIPLADNLAEFLAKLR